MNQKIGFRIITTTALAVILGACATSKSVDQKIAEAQAQTNTKIESVATQVEDLQQKQQATDVRLDQLSLRLSANEGVMTKNSPAVVEKGKDFEFID